MRTRQKLAALGLGALISYGVAESTNERDLKFGDQYFNPPEMLRTLEIDTPASHTNIIGAVGFDLFATAIAYVLLVGNYAQKRQNSDL